MVIKGGHLAKVASDYLFLEDGEVRIISATRIVTNIPMVQVVPIAAVITAELAKGRT